MGAIPPQLLARAVRWCAEAGRVAGPAEVRAALEPLGRDELLAVEAVLARPPPARPLGPAALVDLSRGVAPPVAAERERAGGYRAGVEPPPRAARAVPAARVGLARERAGPVPGVRVRRARERAPTGPGLPPPLPLLDELRRAEGRAVLERLVRRLGARRPALAAALREGWRRKDGLPPAEADLGALLDHHDLERAFERRERALLLHALRAAGGVKTRAAAALELAPTELEAALVRLGAAGEAEAVREAQRRELRRRATLAQRARLVVADQDRLADLGLLEELLADLRARLPEHLKALRAGRPRSLAAALCHSLALSPPEMEALAQRLGLDLEAARPAQHPRSPRPSRRR